MSGFRRQCRGVRPLQSPNQSLPVSGFCFRLHAHTPNTHGKYTHSTQDLQVVALRCERERVRFDWERSTEGMKNSSRMKMMRELWGGQQTVGGGSKSTNEKGGVRAARMSHRLAPIESRVIFLHCSFTKEGDDTAPSYTTKVRGDSPAGFQV